MDTITQEELDRFLITIKLKNPRKNFYAGRERKFFQIQEYAKQVKSLMKQMSKKRTLTFLDCGAGSCYLSFYLNFIFRDRDIRFICVDYNRAVMKRAEEAAFQLGYGNMEFICADLSEFQSPHRPDLVYSLHACDMATDFSLYTGIQNRAAHILSVSCCQRRVYNQMKKHPLVRATEHKVYKERLADMVSDTMRSLILESFGYDTDIFEFASSRHTDKNVMVRGVLTSLPDRRRESALEDYMTLRDTFHLEPFLMELLLREKLCRKGIESLVS